MESLLPFYGLPIETLKERTADAEKIAETFTLVVLDGKVELQWNDNYSRDTWWASRGRADNQINLMEPFIGMLPNFRATYTIHDQPSILLDYQRNKELVDAARQHKGEFCRPVYSNRSVQTPQRGGPLRAKLAQGVCPRLGSQQGYQRGARGRYVCRQPPQGHEPV